MMPQTGMGYLCEATLGEWGWRQLGQWAKGHWGVPKENKLISLLLLVKATSCKAELELGWRESEVWSGTEPS